MKRNLVWWMAAGGLLAASGVGAGLGCSPAARSGDPAQASEILKLSDPLERSLRWSALLQQAKPTAVAELRDAIAASQIDIGDPEIILFAMWWARLEPTGAVEWATSSGGEFRSGNPAAVAAVFREWAHADPEPAFAAALRLPETHQPAALDAVISGWHDSGKPGLVERVQSMPEDAFRQKISESLARRIVLAKGTEGALRWVETIGDPAFRDTMTMRIASTAVVQGDAAAIAAWATPRISSGKDPVSGFPRRIGTRWILRDAPAALKWLSSLPAGNDRDDGVAESFRDWMRFMPGPALEWIHTAPLESWAEPACAVYARAMIYRKPQEALDLVARFTDQDLRNRTIIVLARAWGTRDAKAAREWLARADVPDYVRQQGAATLNPQQPVEPASAP